LTFSVSGKREDLIWTALVPTFRFLLSFDANQLFAIIIVNYNKHICSK